MAPGEIEREIHERSAAILRRLREEKLLPQADIEHLAFIEAAFRFSLATEQALSAHRRRLERAAAALRRTDVGETARLRAMRRELGLERATKRDPIELAYAYANLTQCEGTVPISIRSGPRAPLERRIDGCPLSPEDALAVLREVYDSASTDAIVAQLHQARRLPGTPDLGRLPDRWKR